MIERFGVGVAYAAMLMCFAGAAMLVVTLIVEAPILVGGIIVTAAVGGLLNMIFGRFE